MRRFVMMMLFGCVAFSTHGVLSNGAPTIGQQAIEDIEIGAKSHIHQEMFRGGQRACVIVKANRDEATEMKVTVTDSKTREVVAQHHALNYAICIWYPPRDAEYTIAVSNQELSTVSFDIALR